MKKVALPLIFALIASLFLLYPKAPEMTGIKLLQVPNLTKSNINIKSEANFYNPNFFGLTLKNYDIDVIITDKSVGKITQPESREIPMRSNFSIPVDLDFKRKEVFGGNGFFKDILKNTLDNNLNIQYKGTVDVEVLGIGIPMDIDYTQPLVQAKMDDQ